MPRLKIIGGQDFRTRSDGRIIAHKGHEYVVLQETDDNFEKAIECQVARLTLPRLTSYTENSVRYRTDRRGRTCV